MNHSPAEYSSSTNPENTQRKDESWRKKASIQEQCAIDYFSEILDEFGEESVTDNVFIGDSHYSFDDTNTNNTHSNNNTESMINPQSIESYRKNFTSNSTAKPETWRERASVQEQYAIDYFSEVLDGFSTDSITDSDSIFGSEDHLHLRENDSNINASIIDNIESLALPLSQAQIQSGKMIKDSTNTHCKNCGDSLMSSGIKKSSFHPKPRNKESDRLNISSTTITKMESWRKKANEQEQSAIDFFSEVLSEFSEESNKDNVFSMDKGNALNNRTLENISRAEIHPAINVNRTKPEYNPLDKKHSLSQSAEYLETYDHVANLRDKTPSKGRVKQRSTSCVSLHRRPRNEYKIEVYKTTDIPGSVWMKSDSKQTIDQTVSEMANIKSYGNDRNEGKHPERQKDVSVNKRDKHKERHKLVYTTVRSGPKQKSNLRPMAGLSRSSLLS